MNKFVWRKKGKQERERLSKTQLERISISIQQQLFTLEEWETCKQVLCFVSQANEIQTYPIMKQAWATGKEVYVPKVDSDQQCMQFFRIHTMKELNLGAFGILEPSSSPDRAWLDRGIDSPFNETSHTSLLIVPGLVFDSLGYRIGYGGGYYDRFMQKHMDVPTIISVGLIMHDLLVTDSQLPAEEYDQRVDYVITENKVITVHL